MADVARIQAWKMRDDGKSMSPCDKDDPDAFQFRVSFVNSAYPEQTLDFDNLFKAEEVQRAFFRVFEAGKKAAKAELREWLEVPRK